MSYILQTEDAALDKSLKKLSILKEMPGILFLNMQVGNVQ
jgi:hypothetical protein